MYIWERAERERKPSSYPAYTEKALWKIPGSFESRNQTAEASVDSK
jgi:hypothetical protein